MAGRATIDKYTSEKMWGDIPVYSPKSAILRRLRRGIAAFDDDNDESYTDWIVEVVMECTTLDIDEVTILCVNITKDPEIQTLISMCIEAIGLGTSDNDDDDEDTDPNAS